jgi:hypothetical protein
MGRDDKSIISVRPMHDLQDPATTVWDRPDTEFQHLPPGALFPPCPIHTRLNPGGGRHAAH